MTVKNHTKVNIKIFLPCPVLLNFSILFQVFRPRFSEQTNFWSKLWSASLKLSFFDVLYNVKAFLRFKKKIKRGSCVNIQDLMVLYNHYACLIQVKSLLQKAFNFGYWYILIELRYFLGEIGTCFRRMIHHQKCREKKKHFQRV